jgi:hypothetical protein
VEEEAAHLVHATHAARRDTARSTAQANLAVEVAAHSAALAVDVEAHLVRATAAARRDTAQLTALPSQAAEVEDADIKLLG